MNGEDVDEPDRTDLGKIVNVDDLDKAFTLGLERLKTCTSHAWTTMRKEDQASVVG